MFNKLEIGAGGLAANLKSWFRWLVGAESSLRGKAVKSSVWVLLGNVAGQAMALTRVVVLARLLAPNDFGLMAIATITIGGLDALTQSGYQAALIQKIGDVRDYLNTAFSVQLIRGAALAALIFFLAPLAGSFFNNPDAIRVLRVISLSLIVQGLANPATLLFQKELDLKKHVVWNLCDPLAQLVVGVGLAIVLRNVWALVGAQIAGSCVKASMSFVLHPFRPKLRFVWTQARDLANYGKWVFGTNCMAYISTNLDVAAVVKIVGTASAGIYQMAYRFTNLPSTALAQVFSTVAFPLYAKVQGDIMKLRKVFFVGLNASLLLGFPLALFFMILARPLTSLVLGSKWLAAAPSLSILGAYGLLRMLLGLGGILFEGLGHPKCNTQLNVIRLITLAVLVYPLTHFLGIDGTAMAAVGSMITPLPYWLLRCSKFLEVSSGALIWQTLRTAARVLFGWGLPLLLGVKILPVDRFWGVLLVLTVASIAYGLVAFGSVRRMLVGDTTGSVLGQDDSGSRATAAAGNQ